MVTYNDRILVPNTAKDGLDTVHPETNTGNIYDFKNDAWLDTTLDNLQKTVDAHIVNDTIHVTPADSTRWNSVASRFGAKSKLINSWDEAKENGLYISSTNSPTGGFSYGQVIADDIGLAGIQIAYPYQSNEQYTRTFTNNVFGAWVKSNNQDDLILPPSVDAVLEVGWTTVGQYPLRYYKDAFGIVHIGGRPGNTNATSGNVLITILPVGYRPPTLIEVQVGSGITSSRYITIHPDGRLEYYVDTAGNTNALINTSFRTT